MEKKKIKNYPNVRVSPQTFEILGYLKMERGSSYDTVIRDMLFEFAPFLVHMIESRDDPNTAYMGDKEKILSHNIRLGAKSAYTSYWLRVKRRLEDVFEDEEEVSIDKKEIQALSEARKLLG
jgi:hypothetical protein